MANKRILFVYTRLTTFVQGDINILEKEYHLSLYCVDNTSKTRQLLAMSRLFFYLLFHINKFDIIFTWFADYHSYLPIFFAKYFSKKSYVVIAGYSVSRIRSLKYGSFVNPVRGYMTKYSMKNATLNLCVSKHVERVVRSIAPLAKRELLYDGITFSSATPTSKENTVLCVALSSSKQTFYIKGIDRYISVARIAKDIKFVIVGLDEINLSHLIGDAPENLEIMPRLPHDELVEYFTKAKVYCQLSRSESFAVSLAEAMYHNCVPVITNIGGMPEVAGDFGYKVKGDDAIEVVVAIRSAMNLPSSDKYRERVNKMFTTEVRAKALLDILERTA